MTATRNYTCNLCHDPIRDGTGRGVIHATSGLQLTTLVQAENHLCDRCLSALQRALRDGWQRDVLGGEVM